MKMLFKLILFAAAAALVVPFKGMSRLVNAIAPTIDHSLYAVIDAAEPLSKRDLETWIFRAEITEACIPTFNIRAVVSQFKNPAQREYPGEDVLVYNATHFGGTTGIFLEDKKVNLGPINDTDSSLSFWSGVCPRSQQNSECGRCKVVNVIPDLENINGHIDCEKNKNRKRVFNCFIML
ncbi:hypothetical protein CC80DRAFT_268867 [Byssothecium circinans]|uniref:Uncharacterized protein n=1 Tax=Byssothecium circinans TaxID=147558 RepID=A0A6A5UIR8_9PLEO|nr:hypothetical protein CC80DRAFT_268867 [Byssothecium circinans]